MLQVHGVALWRILYESLQRNEWNNSQERSRALQEKDKPEEESFTTVKKEGERNVSRKQEPTKTSS